MRKVGILIQARMSSTRLPGKVLKTLEGKPLIERVVERARRSSAEEVVVVTSNHPNDDTLCAHLEKAGIPYYRGSLDDVLGRYAEAEKRFGLGVVVRVTADCPLIDPAFLDRMITAFEESGADALFTTDSVPDGFRANVLSAEALERIAAKARLKSEREHVVPYIWNHPEEFKVARYGAGGAPSELHLSVDYEEDLALVEEIYRRLYPENPAFALDEVLRELARDPALAAMNATITRVDGYAKSKAEDGPAAKPKLALYCVEEAEDIEPAMTWRSAVPRGEEREIVMLKSVLTRRMDPWVFVPLERDVLGAEEYVNIDRSVRELGQGWAALAGTEPPAFRGTPLKGFFASPMCAYFFSVLKQVALWDRLIAAKRPSEVLCVAGRGGVRGVAIGAGESVTERLLAGFSKKYDFCVRTVDAASREQTRVAAPGDRADRIKQAVRGMLYALQNVLASDGAEAARIVFSGAPQVLSPLRPRLHLNKRYDVASFWRFWNDGTVAFVVPEPPKRADAHAPEFTGSYFFCGVDVLGIARPKFEHIFRNAYPRVLGRLDFWTRFFETKKTEWLVIDEDVSEWNRSLITAAKAVGAKTLVVQHGLPAYPVGFAPVTADFFAAWGRQSAKTLKAWGVPVEKIVEVGAPRYDALFRKGPCRDRNGRIVLILPKTKTPTNPGRYGIDHLTLDYTNGVIRAVFEAARAIGGREVRVKPHPAETQLGALRESLHRNASGVQYELADAAVPASSLMEGSALVIGCESAAMLEALILGIPSICLNFSASPDVYDLVATGASAGVYRPADVQPAVENAIWQSSEAAFVRKRAELLPYYFADTEGRAAERCADFLSGGVNVAQ